MDILEAAVRELENALNRSDAPPGFVTCLCKYTAMSIWSYEDRERHARGLPVMAATKRLFVCDWCFHPDELCACAVMRAKAEKGGKSGGTP